MTEELIRLTIDGDEVTVPPGTTLLQATARQGTDTPVICYSDKTTPNGLCRLCVVDVDGGRLLQPACIVECQDGMQVETQNDRVKRSRRTILEMLNASVDLSEAPEIQQHMQTYQADKARFPAATAREHPVRVDNPFFVRDYSQCVTCWRCVQVCAEDAQYTFALTLEGRGHNTAVSTAFDADMMDSPCVFCGQCIDVCPTGALKPVVEWGMEQGLPQEAIHNLTRRPRRRKQSEETST